MPQSIVPSPASHSLPEWLDSLIVRALPKRGITATTAKHFDYTTGQDPRGNYVHAAYYRDDFGNVILCKIRDTGPDGEGKDFVTFGDTKKLPNLIYGSHLWGNGGKMVVITEGEIDAMTVSQLFGNKYPVGSVGGGAQAAHKAISANLEKLNKFDKIILFFDQDVHGRKAVEECAKLLPPGKAYVAHLSEKDANAALLAGKGEEVIRACWQAKEFRPDGIVAAADLIELALDPPVVGLPWPWPFLTKWTYGRRYGETYCFGAGTGIGKTDALATIVAHTLGLGESCAVFNYEAGPVTTLKSVAGKIAGKRFHIPDDTGHLWTMDELKATLGKDEIKRLFINDHFGKIDWEAVKERCRYLRHAHNVRHFFIDPLSALTAGDDNERGEIDKIVLECAALGQELESCMYIGSHLTRPSLGPSHEEGGQVRLSQFRGSNAIGMFCMFVFGMERNQQATDAAERSKTTWRSLKDRYTGNSVGQTRTTVYNNLSGMLEESYTNEPESTGTQPFDPADDHLVNGAAAFPSAA